MRKSNFNKVSPASEISEGGAAFVCRGIDFGLLFFASFFWRSKRKKVKKNSFVGVLANDKATNNTNKGVSNGNLFYIYTDFHFRECFFTAFSMRGDTQRG